MRARLLLMAAVLAFVGSAFAQEFTFDPPGSLQGQGEAGLTSEVNYIGDIRFPLEVAPAFLNSQIYGPGGYKSQAGGGQCATENYSYPWRDNFCETRGWDVSMCPSSKGHQGQDIRPATCKKDLYWAVAAEDGMIAQIGKYTVTLQTASGRLYRYLHLNMTPGVLQVRVGQLVLRGDRIGLVSNHFDGTPTTIHLHFDVKGPVISNGKVTQTYLSPYPTLVAAYQDLLAGRP